MKIKYIIPSFSLNESLLKHIEAVEAVYIKNKEEMPPVSVYVGDDENNEFENKKVEIHKIKLNYTSVFEKFVVSARELKKEDYIILSTADDLSYFSYCDVNRMRDCDARVGTGHFLLCRPVNNSRFRIFKGWTHLSEYMGLPPSIDKFNDFIAEGPHSVWACYEREYYISLAELINDLMQLLVDKNVVLIEDIINLSNLLVKDMFCSDSASLRFMDGNYGKKKNFILSIRAFDDIYKNNKLELLCVLIKKHLSRCYAMKASTFEINLNQIAKGLYFHCIGYSTMKSRKWRDWIDVDWRPFEKGKAGVGPSFDSLNPYLNVFVWPDKLELNEKFPKGSWISNAKLVNFIRCIHDDIWYSHAID